MRGRPVDNEAQSPMGRVPMHWDGHSAAIVCLASSAVGNIRAFILPETCSEEPGITSAVEGWSKESEARVPDAKFAVGPCSTASSPDIGFGGEAQVMLYRARPCLVKQGLLPIGFGAVKLFRTP